MKSKHYFGLAAIWLAAMLFYNAFSKLGLMSIAVGTLLCVYAFKKAERQSLKREHAHELRDGIYRVLEDNLNDDQRLCLTIHEGSEEETLCLLADPLPTNTYSFGVVNGEVLSFISRNETSEAD